jgi:hypothetical protein
VTGNGTLAKSVPVTLNIGNAPPNLCVTALPVPLGSVKAGKTTASRFFLIANVGDDVFDADDLSDLSVVQDATDGSLNVNVVSYTTNSVTIAISANAGKNKGHQVGGMTFKGSRVALGAQAAKAEWDVD